MKTIAVLILLAAVFWLVRANDRKNQTDAAGERQNALNFVEPQTP